MSTKRPPTKQKEKMLAQARALFWKKGYQGTTVRDIANAYGCKPANIYNFFPSKEEILFEVLLEEMEQVVNPIRILEDDEETSPIQQLRQLIEAHVKLTLGHRRTSKMLFDVALDNLPTPKRKEIIGFRDTYDRILRKIISRGIEQGCFVDINPKLAGFMIASMIVRIRLWFHPRKGLLPHELADFIFDFTLNGLTGNNTLESSLRESS